MSPDAQVTEERSSQAPSGEPVLGLVHIQVAEDMIQLNFPQQSLRFWWGHEGLVGTAAFWADQVREAFAGVSTRLGRNLAEEVAACILGGFGMPAEVALAAFHRLRDAGVVLWPERAAIERLLREPLQLPNGRVARYRFPRQRAQLVYSALTHLQDAAVPSDGRELRDWLLTLRGVGPKTSAWIARNHTGCDEIAIIDVHVRRAGTAAGFFSPKWKLGRDYRLFEAAFVAVAQLADLRAAELDACIWGTLHQSRAVRQAVSRLAAQRELSAGARARRTTAAPRLLPAQEAEPRIEKLPLTGYGSAKR